MNKMYVLVLASLLVIGQVLGKVTNKKEAEEKLKAWPPCEPPCIFDLRDCECP